MLDERKTAILRAVVQEYITTAQPVGSGHVASAPGVNVSSATVRNEMAVLEQEGYLLQPHTSAGRVPTDKGYRFFVDHLAAARPPRRGAHPGGPVVLRQRPRRPRADAAGHQPAAQPADRLRRRRDRAGPRGGRPALGAARLAGAAHHPARHRDGQRQRRAAPPRHRARRLGGGGERGHRPSRHAPRRARRHRARPPCRPAAIPPSTVCARRPTGRSWTPPPARTRSSCTSAGRRRWRRPSTPSRSCATCCRPSSSSTSSCRSCATCSTAACRWPSAPSTAWSRSRRARSWSRPTSWKAKPVGTVGVLGPTRMNYPHALAAVDVVSERLGRRLSDG